MTQVEQELRAALAALPDSRFEACRGAEGTGCTCGHVWAVSDQRVAFVAERERFDDFSPGYTPEQARAHAEALETILNALPQLLDDLTTARAAQATAEQKNIRLMEVAYYFAAQAYSAGAPVSRATLQKMLDRIAEARAAAQRAEGDLPK